MEIAQTKLEQSVPQRTPKYYVFSQLILRIAASVAALAAAALMATNKEATIYVGYYMDAKYTYTGAFRFLVAANAAACIYSLLSLPFVCLLASRSSDQKGFFPVFLLDLTVMGVVAAASSAATAIGSLGKYGNDQIGWGSICDHFGRFCDRANYSIMCSYATIVLFFLLTVLSARRPRQASVFTCSRPHESSYVSGKRSSQRREEIEKHEMLTSTF